MNEPVLHSLDTTPSSPGPGFCSYCKAPLQPQFYFCSNCAMPYKTVESVLPRPRPLVLTMGDLVARKAPGVSPLFWTFFAVVVGAALFGYLFFPLERPDLVLILQSVLLFITTCVFAALHWPSLVVQFKRFGFHRPAALFGLLGLVPLLAVNYFYHSWLIRHSDVYHVMPLDRLRDLGLGEPALILLFCVFPALVEETAFRGLIQHWLMTALTPWRAMALAAALFTILHFTVLSAPYIFAVGLLLGWTRWKTGSLYPSIFIHFLHNLVAIEFFFR